MTPAGISWSIPARPTSDKNCEFELRLCNAIRVVMAAARKEPGGYGAHRKMLRSINNPETLHTGTKADATPTAATYGCSAYAKRISSSSHRSEGGGWLWTVDSPRKAHTYDAQQRRCVDVQMFDRTFMVVPPIPYGQLDSFIWREETKKN